MSMHYHSLAIQALIIIKWLVNSKTSTANQYQQKILKFGKTMSSTDFQQLYSNPMLIPNLLQYI